MGEVDITKVLVSKKISFGEKNYRYFIGYVHKGKKSQTIKYNVSENKSLCKIYNEQTKWMYFLIKDDALLEKYNTIWDKFSADIKK